MRIIVPALMGHPEAAFLALHAEGLEPQLRALRDGHDTDYGDMYADLWKAGETFCVVEHDIVPWPGAMRKLEECRQAWCIHQYPLGTRGYLGGSIGCVKFRGTLLVATRDFARRLVGQSWIGLDGVIEGYLQHLGFTAHIHEPPVAHAKSLVDWNAPGSPALESLQ